MLLSSYPLYIILTASTISSVLDSPQTYVNKIKLCKANPNYVLFNEVSEVALDAIIISEDQDFYEHHGFDLNEIFNSIKKNMLQLQFVRGGSTISQQVVKNIFLGGEKSIHRKIQEAFLTIKLEYTLSKKQILEKYINLIELGPGIFGIKAASEFYFHKDPSRLTILESAYLAHLLPNPKDYSKTFDEQRLTKYSRAKVLSICLNLWGAGKISADQYLSTKKLVDDFPWYGMSS